MLKSKCALRTFPNRMLCFVYLEVNTGRGAIRREFSMKNATTCFINYLQSVRRPHTYTAEVRTISLYLMFNWNRMSWN
jgi:hypothetical protein